MPLPLKYLGLIETGTPAENFITSGCLRPRKIFVYNSVTCKNEPLYVDCGHCIKCRDQKRNELATRMILHAKSEPWHHVYFVTLTYGSYNLNIYNKHPFKADWLETFPVQDSFNYSQRLAWTPSILVSNHFVKFMKRLRKQDQSNIISFANCGELGGKYGRPHFHAIIYSSKPLTRQNVVDAWSLDCYQKANGDVVRYAGKFCPGSRRFTFHIGKVDFYDLVANGTCDFDSVKNPSESNSSKNCFQYVAKYCVKTNGLRDMNKFALRRYHAVYDQLNEGIQYLALSGFFQLHPNEKILVTPHNGEPKISLFGVLYNNIPNLLRISCLMNPINIKYVLKITKSMKKLHFRNFATYLEHISHRLESILLEKLILEKTLTALKLKTLPFVKFKVKRWFSLLTIIISWRENYPVSAFVQESKVVFHYVKVAFRLSMDSILNSAKIVIVLNLLKIVIYLRRVLFPRTFITH